MIIVSWNVRGLNSPIKIKEIKQFFDINNVSVIGLLETKIKSSNAQKIQKKFGTQWNWCTNYSHHEKGRMWVGWRHDRCKVEQRDTNTQFISTKITPINSNLHFFVVFVYGLHSVRDRREMWKDMEQLEYNSPCLYMGDFNAIYKDEHRKNGSQVSTYETYDMQQWLERKELHPISERGHRYSWTNKEVGDNRTLTKIDHAIGNSSG